MIEFTVEGLDELIARLGVDLKPAFRAATFAVGEQLRGKLAVYPKGSNQPVKWSSLKQRTFYHAMRRRQGLPLQYSRGNDPGSQQLLKSWTTASHGDTDAIVATKGVTYAKWVQSAESQWQQHAATGWVTDKAAIEQLQADNVIPDIIRDAVDAALNG